MRYFKKDLLYNMLHHIVHRIKSAAIKFLSVSNDKMFCCNCNKSLSLATQYESVLVALPSESFPQEILDTARELKFSPGNCIQITPAWLVGRHAAVVQGRLGLYTGSIGGDGYYPEDSLTWKNIHEILRLRLNPNRYGRPKVNVAVPLVHRFSRGYYHWVVEELPRLQTLETFMKENASRPTLIIPGNAPSFIYQSLNLLGYQTEFIKEWSERTTLVSELILPSFRDHFNWLPVSVLIWMRERFTAAAIDMGGELKPTVSNRIYISRRKAGRRKILQESELTSRLEKMGFTCVDLEDLTFQQQILLFKEAEIIVGPHGAGLTNMIWSEQARIVEIFGQPIIPCYYKLARQLGFEYTCVVGDVQDGDIRINLEFVIEAISNLIDINQNYEP